MAHLIAATEAGGQPQPLPPLTRAGILTVIGGVVLILAASLSLWLGDTRVLDACGVRTTRELLDKDNPKTSLVITEEIKSCEPSTLAGGLPLILAIAGGVCIAPGILRLLPRGKYKAGPVEADTTENLGEAAKTQAEVAAATYLKLELGPVDPAAEAQVPATPAEQEQD